MYNRRREWKYLATSAATKRIALIDARDIAAVAVAALTEDDHAGKIYDQWPRAPRWLRAGDNDFPRAWSAGQIFGRISR